MSSFSRPFLFICALLISAQATAHEATLRAEHYASEHPPVQARVDADFRWRSDASVAGGLAARELRVYGFYASGSRGDRSIEPDRAVFRWNLGDGHFWLGRTLPLAEGSPFAFHPQSAMGANWAQNQSDALHPSLVGWTGAGIHLRSGDFFFAAAATPFYLPNFGPRVEFSTLQDTRGSRYARLPPQYVRINGNLFPLRFEINTGDLRDIVLQHQAYVSAGLRGAWGAFALHGWTAPTLSPEIDTSEILRVSGSGVDVLITAKPRFPRENYGAATLSLEVPYLHPQMELVREMKGRRLVFSQSIAPVHFLRLGWLHTLSGLKPEKGDGTDTPVYAEQLGWAEVRARFGALEPSLRYERHFRAAHAGAWAEAALQYWLSPAWAIFGALSVITGRDRSYFGGWRSLDSASAGVRAVW